MKAKKPERHAGSEERKLQNVKITHTTEEEEQKGTKRQRRIRNNMEDLQLPVS